MDNQSNFRFPILTISKVRPLLRKDNKVFAYEIIATTQNGTAFPIYETKGLDLSGYLGQKMECLLEITKGEFDYKDEEGKKPKDAFVFEYLWEKRLFEYFPDLVKMREQYDQSDEDEEAAIQDFCETSATKLFEEWGLNGLNIGIYQAKPVLSSPEGFFLLNEHQFEEEIEPLDLNEEIYIKIDELYLRGIRPCISPKDTKQQQIVTQPKPKEDPIQSPPTEEIKEKKKGRFSFLSDKD